MKQRIITLIALLGIITTAAWAESRTVTYTFTANYENYNVSRWTLTFTPSGDGFGYSTGTKEVTIQNTSETTGFTVQLDDGLQLTYSQDEGHLTFWGYNGFYLNGTNDGGNSKLTLTSTHYYVTHVKMATTSGSTLTGTASPWMTASGQLDQDVDMTTQYDGPPNYREFSASFSYAQVFGQLTVTYGDPRPYDITYNNAVNGQNGVTNNNPTSYNVATNDFQVTAPTRTGYTLSGTTFTDAQHPNATAINLNMTPLTIHRGEAVTRKDITFNTSWTANTYTLRLHHNDGTDAYTDQTLTYDQAANIQSVTRTGYHITRWTTNADGTGTSYDDKQEVTNLTATQGAVIDLYAQWDINTYTVRFNKNSENAYGTMADQPFTYGVAQALTANTFTRTGYHFNVWNTRSDGSGTAYIDGQSVSNLTTTNGAEVDLYAWWMANTYTFVFNANGGSGSMVNQVFTYDTAENLRANAFTAPSGYYFIGWNTEADGTGTSFSDNQATPNITAADGATVTLYAQWASLPTYIDADGTERMPEEVKEITSGVTSYGTDGTEAWYIVSGNVNIGSTLTLNGSANIILCDGATLTINATSGSGIFANSREPSDKPSLTIYGQRLGTGTLDVTSQGDYVAIHAYRGLIINGGNVTARQLGSDCALSSTENITINRGNVSATTHNYHAINASGTIIINGGTVRANGNSPYDGNYLAGINCGNIYINGGNVTANGPRYGIKANYKIVLGWTSATDRITSNGYASQNSTVSVKSGQFLTDGTNYYSGTLTNDEKTAIAGQTLQPATLAEFIAYALPQTATNEYTISNEAGWTALCLALQDNDTYNRFSGKTVKLDTDISVTRKAGLTDHDFCGTFDGQGHTLTFNYTTTEGYAAPFRNVANGCVIKNLIVEGTITTSAKFAAGIASRQFGTVSIRNCRSSVTIQSSVKDDGTHGGLVAQIYNNNSAHLTIEGCVFDGKIVSTGTGDDATIKCGGFVGWRGDNGSLTITNSLYTPAALADGETWVGTDGSATFARNWTMPDNANCYYTQALGTAQGKQARRITAGEHVTVANAGNATEYNVSGITSYGTGIKYGNVLYAGSDDQVSLTLGHTYEGYDCTYTASAGTLSGDANPYTLTMPDANVTINATLVSAPIAELTVGSTATSYYIDATYTTAEAALRAALDDAANASGSTVTLFRDVTLATDNIECMSGTYTLDLNGHSITGSDGVLVLGGANITLIDGSSAKTGSITDTGSSEAIVINEGTLNCTGCTISSNLSTGTGVDFHGGTLTLADCTITGNTALYKEAGSSNITLTNCTITGTSYGIMLTDDTRSCYLTINGCTITGNVGIAYKYTSSYGRQSFIGNNTIKGCAFAGILIEDNVPFKGLPHFGTGFDANGCDIVSASGIIDFQTPDQSAYYYVPATPITVKAVEWDSFAGAYVDREVDAGAGSYTFAINCNHIKYPNTDTTIPIEEVFVSLKSDYIVRTPIYHTSSYNYSSTNSSPAQLTKPVVLNDNANNNASTIENFHDEDCAVTLQGRTLYKDGYWNTLCVPFGTNDISTTPLAGAEIRSLSSASLENGTLTLNFSDPVTKLVAGTPYIIKWTKPDGYVDDAAHNLVNPLFSSVCVYNNTDDFTSTDGTVQFKSTYAPITFDAADRSVLFMGSNNTLFYPEAGASIGAFRAYFQLNDPSAQVKAFVLNFGEGDDTETGIVSMEDVRGKTEDVWYNLSGRKLSGKPTQRGIYINNGRKVVIK